MIIPKGKFFIVTDGEYSSYEVLVLCKACKDIEVNSLREEYLSQHEEKRQDYCFEVHHFVKWFIDKKLAEEVEYVEFFLGDYSTADFSVRQLGEKQQP